MFHATVLRKLDSNEKYSKMRLRRNRASIYTVQSSRLIHQHLATKTPAAACAHLSVVHLLMPFLTCMKLSPYSSLEENFGSIRTHSPRSPGCAPHFVEKANGAAVSS